MKRIRSIPPITSTGSRVRNTSAPLSGLANISIGRYMSEMKKKNEKDDNFDITKFSKSDFNKKTPSKSTSNIKYEKSEPINCDKTIIKEKELKVTLEFSGFNFLQEKFKYLEATESFFIPVDYKEDSYLTLTTNGDIIEFEIIYKEYNFNRSYRDEIYIPELVKIYKSTMNVTLEDKKVIITYKKK